MSRNLTKDEILKSLNEKGLDIRPGESSDEWARRKKNESYLTPQEPAPQQTVPPSVMYETLIAQQNAKKLADEVQAEIDAKARADKPRNVYADALSSDTYFSDPKNKRFREHMEKLAEEKQQEIDKAEADKAERARIDADPEVRREREAAASLQRLVGTTKSDELKQQAAEVVALCADGRPVAIQLAKERRELAEAKLYETWAAERLERAAAIASGQNELQSLDEKIAEVKPQE